MPGRDDGTPSLPVATTDMGTGTIPAYQALPGFTRAGDYVVRYDAEVEFMDSELGRLLEGLARARLLDGAVVLFSADHGESLGDHGLYFQHGSSLYEPQIRVPLLISGPGIAPRVEENPVSGVDVLPTILELLVLPQPRGIQGTSLSVQAGGSGLEAGGSGPEAGGEDREPERRTLFAELGSKYAAIRGTRKLIWDSDEKKIELLDLAADPGESRDVFRSEPERGRRLFESVARFARENRRDVKALDDEETKRVLKSLGYVE
jgi:arylsulfatase A-like enzyme